jgi:hypothetical protein
MKLVREHINEKFEEEGDPIQQMGIGIHNQIKKDLQKIGITSDWVKFEDDGTFFLTQSLLYNVDVSKFIDIQEKYFPEAQKELLNKIYHSHNNIESLIDKAREDGLSFDQIERIIINSLKITGVHQLRYNQKGNDLDRAKIYITKLKRTKEQQEEDEENNIYIFIGYTDKVPIMIKGKKYYEDKLAVENMIKIDKFDTAQLLQVSAMKLRLLYQNYTDGAVYMLKVPKEIMDEDHYYKIPDHLYDIVDKYKVKI